MLSQFKFIVEDDIALPVDPKFWDFLLSNAQKDWELFVYEQDFLLTQFGKTKALQVNYDHDGNIHRVIQCTFK